MYRILVLIILVTLTGCYTCPKEGMKMYEGRFFSICLKEGYSYSTWDTACASTFLFRDSSILELGLGRENDRVIGVEFDTVPKRYDTWQTFYRAGDTLVAGEVKVQEVDTSHRWPKYTLLPKDERAMTLPNYSFRDEDVLVFSKVDTIRKIYYKQVVYKRKDAFRYAVVGYMCRSKATDTIVFNEMINTIRWK